jgi:hypothetical protein
MVMSPAPGASNDLIPVDQATQAPQAAKLVGGARFGVERDNFGRRLLAQRKALTCERYLVAIVENFKRKTRAPVHRRRRIGCEKRPMMCAAEGKHP